MAGNSTETKKCKYRLFQVVRKHEAHHSAHREKTRGSEGSATLYAKTCRTRHEIVCPEANYEKGQKQSPMHVGGAKGGEEEEPKSLRYRGGD